MGRIYSQHPGESLVQLHINTFKIHQCCLLGQDHLVEAWYEVRIQEASVEDRQA